MVGNRQTSTLDSAVTTLSYASSSNRLSTLSGATTRSYTYDGVGNPSAIDAQTYTYNLANWLTQVQGGAATAVYGLNALGQRVSKAVGGTTSLFAYDELGHLLSEYDAAGNLIQEVVWLDDLPVATLRPNGTGNPVPIAINYVHADHLGSPRAVTRPSDNNIVWRWDNVDPFGASLANENPTGQGTFRFNLRFPGQYFDAETGTHYNYFRDYDPSIGRYVESDPIGLQGGLNTYAYVGGSPLMQIDAQGLASSGDRFNLPSLPRTNVVCVTNAFLRNYSDMRAANTIDGDKYFHCKANCEAARCGPNGPGLACFISDGREWFDQNIKRDPPSASQEDQVANKYGRDHANDLGMCSGVCGPFRPRGLPPQF